MIEAMPEPVSHFAEAFFVEPGRCFRFIYGPGFYQVPMHCPEPARWRGTFRDGDGKRHTVDSCDGHMHGLEAPVAVTPPA